MTYATYVYTDEAVWHIFLSSKDPEFIHNIVVAGQMETSGNNYITNANHVHELLTKVHMYGE